jgi:hypothetical protein
MCMYDSGGGTVLSTMHRTIEEDNFMQRRPRQVFFIISFLYPAEEMKQRICFIRSYCGELDTVHYTTVKILRQCKCEMPIFITIPVR